MKIKIDKMKFKKSLRKIYFTCFLTALMTSSALAVDNLPESLPAEGSQPSQKSDEQQNQEVRDFFQDLFVTLKEERQLEVEKTSVSQENIEDLALNQDSQAQDQLFQGQLVQDQLVQSQPQFNQIQPQIQEQEVSNIMHFNNNQTFNSESNMVAKSLQVNASTAGSDELFPGSDDLSALARSVNPSNILKKIDPSFDFSPPKVDFSYGDTFKYNKDGMLRLKSVATGKTHVNKSYNIDDPAVVVLKAPKGSRNFRSSSSDSSSAKGKVSKRKNIILKKKPSKDYRNVRMSEKIHKAAYTKENRHLPVAFYENDYQNILYNQILTEDLSVIRAMIERVGGTEVKDASGNTPLLFALKNNKYDAAKVLISMGGDIYQTNANGESIIDYISSSNDSELMRLVSNHDIDTAKKEVMAFRERKISEVSSIQNTNFVNMISKSIEKPNNLDYIGVESSKKLSKIPSRFVDSVTYKTIFNRSGNSIVHNAAIFNDVKALQEAIYNKQNLDKKNDSGYTALMIASFYNNKDIVTSLIKAGVDINLSDAYGRTAKVIAQQNDNLKSYDLLNIANIKKNSDS